MLLVNGANAKERRQQESGQQSTDHPNDNVEEYPLLSVGTHDETGDPSEDAANNEPQNEIPTLPSSLLCAMCIFFLLDTLCPAASPTSQVQMSYPV